MLKSKGRPTIAVGIKNKALKMAEEGLSQNAVAQKLDISQGVVAKIVSDNDYRKQSPRDWASIRQVAIKRITQGESRTVVAKDLQVSKSTVSKWVRSVSSVKAKPINMKNEDDSNIVHLNLTTNISLLVSLAFNEKCKQAQESLEFDSIKAVFIQGARILHRYAELKKDGWTLEFVSPDREKSIQVML